MTARKDKPEPGTEVSVAQDVVGTLMAREGDVIGQYLASEADYNGADPEVVYQTIIQEIMGATTVEEVLNLPETSAFSDHEGDTLELRGFKVLDSDFEAGAPVYFAVGGTNLTDNEKVIITCGEQAVMAQLLRVDQLGGWPIRVVPTAAKRTNRHGKYPLRLKMAAG